ncbi:hypothetical protein B0H19DRAFT_1252327 [Mycena capillaripes]|nr:hypothetical protein B0H19DRAFT_1252327 [Mycena capillaripes]
MKIKWANLGTIQLKASCVEFASSTNSTARFTALARREVIIAGDPGVADALGNWKLGCSRSTGEIDLKTVGRNLQEQTMNSLGAHGDGFDKGCQGPSDCMAS